MISLLNWLAQKNLFFGESIQGKNEYEKAQKYHHLNSGIEQFYETPSCLQTKTSFS